MGRTISAEIFYGFTIGDKYGEFSEPEWFNNYIYPPTDTDEGLSEDLSYVWGGSLYNDVMSVAIKVNYLEEHVNWGITNIDNLIENTPECPEGVYLSLLDARAYLQDKIEEDPELSDIKLSPIGWHLAAQEG